MEGWVEQLVLLLFFIKYWEFLRQTWITAVINLLRNDLSQVKRQQNHFLRTQLGFEAQELDKNNIFLFVFLWDSCFMAHIKSDSCVNSSQDYIAPIPADMLWTYWQRGPRQRCYKPGYHHTIHHSASSHSLIPWNSVRVCLDPTAISSTARTDVQFRRKNNCFSVLSWRDSDGGIKIFKI